MSTDDPDRNTNEDAEEREPRRGPDQGAMGSETGTFPVEDRTPECEDDRPGEDFEEMPSAARQVPGTEDDLPYTEGEEQEVSEDILDMEGPGTGEGTELWQKQQSLIDEDQKAGYRVAGVSEAEGERISEAIGDDASEQAQGESATGESTEEDEHGGFPERGE